MNLAVNTCHTCKILDKRKVQRCSTCKSVHYCSTKCQRDDWPIHKIKCPKFAEARPFITVVDLFVTRASLMFTLRLLAGWKIEDPTTQRLVCLCVKAEQGVTVMVDVGPQTNVVDDMIEVCFISVRNGSPLQVTRHALLEVSQCKITLDEYTSAGHETSGINWPACIIVTDKQWSMRMNDEFMMVDL